MMSVTFNVDGSDKHCAIKIKGLSQDPQIEIVFHPAATDSTLDQGTSPP
jgi:hypothetical protein